MHISEGVLPGWVLVTGWALTAVGTYLGLRKINEKNLPLAALMSAVFFVASLIHVPLGPTSVHLLFNSLTGMLLGWAAFPVLLVALFLQAVLFQFGGITVLGVNTFNMAIGGVVAYYLCRPLLKGRYGFVLAGILGAFVGVATAGILVALELMSIGQAFSFNAKVVLVAHLPVMVIEAIVNVFVLAFLKKNLPEMLGLEVFKDVEKTAS